MLHSACKQKYQYTGGQLKYFRESSVRIKCTNYNNIMSTYKNHNLRATYARNEVHGSKLTN